MRQGETGVVLDVQGGRGICQRLDAMRIIPGVQLRKISGSFLTGPVTVQIGNARVALGAGIASRIILEVEDNVPQ